MKNLTDLIMQFENAVLSIPNSRDIVERSLERQYFYPKLEPLSLGPDGDNIQNQLDIILINLYLLPPELQKKATPEEEQKAKADFKKFLDLFLPEDSPHPKKIGLELKMLMIVYKILIVDQRLSLRELYELEKKSKNASYTIYLFLKILAFASPRGQEAFLNDREFMNNMKSLVGYVDSLKNPMKDLPPEGVNLTISCACICFINHLRPQEAAKILAPLKLLPPLFEHYLSKDMSLVKNARSREELIRSTFDFLSFCFLQHCKPAQDSPTTNSNPSGLIELKDKIQTSLEYLGNAKELESFASSIKWLHVININTLSIKGNSQLLRRTLGSAKNDPDYKGNLKEDLKRADTLKDLLIDINDVAINFDPRIPAQAEILKLILGFLQVQKVKTQSRYLDNFGDTSLLKRVRLLSRAWIRDIEKIEDRNYSDAFVDLIGKILLPESDQPQIDSLDQFSIILKLMRKNLMEQELAGYRGMNGSQIRANELHAISRITPRTLIIFKEALDEIIEECNKAYRHPEGSQNYKSYSKAFYRLEWIIIYISTNSPEIEIEAFFDLGINKDHVVRSLEPEDMPAVRLFRQEKMEDGYTGNQLDEMVTERACKIAQHRRDEKKARLSQQNLELSSIETSLPQAISRIGQ